MINPGDWRVASHSWSEGPVGLEDIRRSDAAVNFGSSLVPQGSNGHGRSSGITLRPGELRTD